MVGNPAQRNRRSERARVAILRATDDLLVEHGFSGVTMEAIAARAGVGKQTIYRWWSSKADVLMDAFLEDAAEELPIPDTGRLEQDLLLYLRRLARFLARSDAGQVLRALLGEAQHDRALAARFRRRHLHEQRSRELVLLTRAVQRGELARDIDVDIALDELLGPIYYRIMVTDGPVGESFTDQLVARFLAGS